MQKSEIQMTLSSIVDVVLHLNLYVADLINQYHIWAYAFIMLIVFCETGLVVALFLPGDSLLFATGIVLAAIGRPIWPAIVLLILAAFAGDNCNYWVGRLLGRKLFVSYPRFFKLEYLEATERFYLKYGVKAILMARYIPFFRTFVPFFGGLSKMSYPLYLFFSFISACIWVNLLLLTSYYFGNIAFISQNFSLAILAIIIVSATPALYHFLKQRRLKKNAE